MKPSFGCTSGVVNFEVRGNFEETTCEHNVSNVSNVSIIRNPEVLSSRKYSPGLASVPTSHRWLTFAAGNVQYLISKFPDVPRILDVWLRP